MKKYTIELSEEQMSLIAQCLEDVSRFASGQWEMQNTIEAMVKHLDFDEQIKRRDVAERFLRQAKRELLPKLSDNSSKGYNGSEFIGNTYQIYITILHQFAKDKNWDNVYSSPALPSGNLGTIKIDKLFKKETIPKGFKIYECTDCKEINVKKDNRQIRVGFCDNC